MTSRGPRRFSRTALLPRAVLLPRPVLRILSSAVIIGVAPLSVSSCLTPHFEFDDATNRLQGDGDGDGGGGGGTKEDDGSPRTMGEGGGGPSSKPTHCSNRVQDEDESDVDCGGSCTGCRIGASCESYLDCEAPPVGSADIIQCSDDKCALDCRRNFDDCNSSAKDGCEADLLSDLEHCGGCGQECNPAFAVAQCVSGVCRIDPDEPNRGCFEDYANCNWVDEDGCEVTLRTDPDHCGACEDASCSSENGSRSCAAGQCAIQCDPGFADCDNNAANNGCEVETSVNVNHCGRCGHVCSTSGEGWAAYCEDGECGETQCDLGKGDCDGDGECTDDLNTVEDCGKCGDSCSVENGTPACETQGDSLSCAVASCEPGWDDCDASYATGCEVNTEQSTKRCGGCLPSENGAGVDCSSKEGNDHVTITSCQGGRCQIAACETGFADCDGVFENGCEIDTQRDEDNCGACAARGGDLCSEREHASNQCASGNCEYLCDENWTDANNDRYHETSDGCETPQLAIVGNGAWGSLDTGTAQAPLTIDHQLRGEPATGRLILVGVICRDTEGNANNCQLSSPRYGDTPLVVLQRVFNNRSGAALYYALDANLPQPGAHTVSLGKPGAGSLSAEVIELQGVEQEDDFFSVHGGANNGNDCDSALDAEVALEGIPDGSIIYAVAGGAQNTADGGNAQAFAPFNLSRSEGANYIVFGSSTTEWIGGDRTAVFDLSACNHSSVAAVAVRPAGND